jgi:hypothetical protein
MICKFDCSYTYSKVIATALSKMVTACGKHNTYSVAIDKSDLNIYASRCSTIFTTRRIHRDGEGDKYAVYCFNSRSH